MKAAFLLLENEVVLLEGESSRDKVSVALLTHYP